MADWSFSEVEAGHGGRIRFWRPTQEQAAPVLHFAHATGFHAHTYTPLFHQLRDLPVCAWDARGHGASAAAAALDSFRSWRLYARDLHQWLRQQGQPVWLVGHSVGATVSALVAARYPQQVRGLILIEPVFLSRRQGWSMRFGQLSGLAKGVSLAAAAARRRAVFASREEIFDSYFQRGAFKTWPEEWVRAYIEHGFVPDPQGLRLACSPEWESRSFALTLANPWALVRRIKVPMVIHLGEPRFSTVNAAARATLRRLAPQADMQVWPQATHFLPMEQTAALARSIHTTVANADSNARPASV